MQRASLLHPGFSARLCQISMILLATCANSQNITIRENRAAALDLWPVRNFSNETATRLNRTSVGRGTFRKVQEYGSLMNKSSRIEATVPGKAGVDYPTYNHIPATTFTCVGRLPGYYADEEARCQVFHVCYSARRTAKQSFLCPNGTIFNQPLRICEWWTKVNCHQMVSFSMAHSNYSIKSENDMMVSQTITKEVNIVYPRNLRQGLWRNDRKSNYSRAKNSTNTNNVTGNLRKPDSKLLLDNMFINFTDNKIIHSSNMKTSQVNRTSSRRDSARNKIVNRGSVTYKLSNDRAIRSKSNSTVQSDSTKYQNPLSNNYDNMNLLIPMIYNDKLSMIDKLIYATDSEHDRNSTNSGETTSSSSNQNVFTQSSRNVEIIPSVIQSEIDFDETSNGSTVITNVSNLPLYPNNNQNNNSAVNTLLVDMRNLNAKFFKYKDASNGISDHNITSKNTSNTADQRAKSDTKGKVNATQYGLYYLTDGQYKPPPSKDNHYKQSLPITLLTNQFFRNNNYKDYLKIRQNTVMPSIPKVSDILTGFHHLNQQPVNTNVHTINNNKNNMTLIHQNIRQPKQITEFHGDNNKLLDINEKIKILNSIGPFNTSTGKVYRMYIQLKELDQNKVKINENPVKQMNQQTEPQIEITQRPIYRFNSTSSKNAINVNSYNDKMKNVNIRVGDNPNNHKIIASNAVRNDNHVVLGSTALYGIDLLASTSVINNFRNHLPNGNPNLNQNKPALSLSDIHTINHLQDGSNVKNSIIQSHTIPQEVKQMDSNVQPQNITQSFISRPFSNQQVVRPTNGKLLTKPQYVQNRNQAHHPSQFRSERKHDSVIVLPSLGFSLNSEDEIKAFNHAISAGLLDENR